MNLYSLSIVQGGWLFHPPLCLRWILMHRSLTGTSKLLRRFNKRWYHSGLWPTKPICQQPVHSCLEDKGILLRIILIASSRSQIKKLHELLSPIFRLFRCKDRLLDRYSFEGSPLLCSIPLSLPQDRNAVLLNSRRRGDLARKLSDRNGALIAWSSPTELTHRPWL